MPTFSYFQRVRQMMLLACGWMTTAATAEEPGLTASLLLKEAAPMPAGMPGMIFFTWGLTFLASYNIYLAATASWRLWRQPQRLQLEVERWSYVAGFTLRPKAFVTGLWAGLMVIVFVCLLFIKHVAPRLEGP